MLTVTIDDYARACGLTTDGASARLRGVPFTRTGKGPRRYALAWALPSLGRKYRLDAVNLLASAQLDASGLYIGGDEVLQHAQELCDWLEADPTTAERLKWVRGQFFNGLAATARGQAAFYTDSERLRLLIAAADAVLPFVLTGEKAGLPAFAGGYSRAIALLHHAGEAVAA